MTPNVPLLVVYKYVYYVTIWIIKFFHVLELFEMAKLGTELNA